MKCCLIEAGKESGKGRWSSANLTLGEKARGLMLDCQRQGVAPAGHTWSMQSTPCNLAHVVPLLGPVHWKMSACSSAGLATEKTYRCIFKVPCISYVSMNIAQLLQFAAVQVADHFSAHPELGFCKALLAGRRETDDCSSTAMIVHTADALKTFCTSGVPYSK